MKLRQMIPQSSKPKPATPIRRTNASTRAASMEEEEAEPTVRFSTALIVVLLLHVVAIGGVYTFDAVKVKHSSKNSAAAEEVQEETVAPVSPAAALASTGQEVKPAALSTNAPKQASAPVKPAAKSTANASTATASKAAASKTALAASGEIHVVKKGENPLAIAKQYGVDYETLLKLNKIDDPRRLQIGQKLQIPAK